MNYITRLTWRKTMFSSPTMTMMLAGFVLLVLLSSTVQAQWATNGTNISNTNSGNVGIGTATPGSLLEINKSQNAGTTVVIDNAYNALSTSAYSGLLLKQAGANRFFFGSLNDNNTTSTGGGGAGQVWNFANAPILFATNNLERMRINATGSIGIGTVNPVFDANVARFLTVDGGSGSIGSIGAAGGTSSNGTTVGQVAFINSNLGTTEKRVATIVGATDTATNSGTLDFYTANAGTWVPRLRINSAGNIGVGTTSPGFRFDVQGGQLNASGGLCIAGDCKTAWSQVGGGGSQWTTSGANVYYNNGNVGIGTTSPAASLLHLQSATHTYLRIGAPLGSQSAIAFNDDSNGQDIVLYRRDGTRDFSIWTATSLNVLNVTQAGNVGIGTTTPNKSGGTKALTVNGSTDSIYELAIGDVRKGTVYHDGSELSLNNNANGPLVLRTNNTEKLRIDAGGNVGIGATSTGSKLHVAGDGRFTGNLVVDGNIAAKYQDVAEWVESSQQLSAGTVVVLDQSKSNQVIASSCAYDTRVAGVISLQPGIALGEKSDNKVLVATTGRVRVKVDATTAPIHVGDLLVTSDLSGVAKKSEPLNLGGAQIHRPGTLIGKALEPLEKGTGEILVLLSLQ
ncbi:MAG TPA: hypothetical protein VLL54_20715 [Pyrinomonadaceae bacterium]|nr:hypothetical protein [Pyrinomonadaceae bacterium]